MKKTDNNMLIFAFFIEAARKKGSLFVLSFSNVSFVNMVNGQ